MNLAVKLYSSLSAEENPQDIPGAWPAQTKALGDSTDLPGGDWVLMTQLAYEDYITAHQQEYIDWKSALDAIPEPEDNSLQTMKMKQFGRDIADAMILGKKELRIAFELSFILPALDSGNLYLCLRNMAKAELNDTLTSDLLLQWGNKIRDYLSLDSVGAFEQLAEGF